MKYVTIRQEEKTTDTFLEKRAVKINVEMKVLS